MHLTHLFEAQYDNADLKRRYDHYNALLFNGALPDIPIEYAKLKRVGGHVLAQTRTDAPVHRAMRRFAKKTLVPGSVRMQISTFYQREPQAMDGILIHEMVHVHFFSIGDFEENHGGKFIRMCQDLSRKVGFTIPLTDDVTGLAMTDAPKRKVGVIIVTKKDNTQRAAVVSEAYVRDNLDALRARWEYFLKYNYAEKVQIIVTTGRIEGVYPVQRKKVTDLAYFPIKEPALIDEALEKAEVLATLTK